MLGVPVCRAKRAAVASCVLSPSVSCRFLRSTVASVGLHGLGNAWQLITPGVFDAIVMRALVGRVLTEPWTSFCVRRLARFEIAGVDTSSTPGAPVPWFSSRRGRLRRDFACASLMPGRVGLRNTRATLPRVKGRYVCIRVRLSLPYRRANNPNRGKNL
jgi:hypothetical protein